MGKKMQLDSARALKQELTQTVDRQLRIRPEVLNSVRLSKPAHEKFDIKPPLAMGISHHQGEHKLALRIHHSHPEVEKLVDYFRDKTRGEIDVKTVGRVHPQSNELPVQRKRQRPLCIGHSVGLVDMNMGAGTIAFFATSAGKSKSKTFVVSNNHVLAKENEGKKGEAVIQPGPADDGDIGKDCIAKLERFVKLEKTGNSVDAAIAVLDDEVSCDMNSLPGLGRLKGMRDDLVITKEKVFKIGRTTGLTEGEVTAFEIDGLRVSFPYPLLTLTFDDQMEVSPISSTKPFSLGGDSGALVVDSEHRALGLLFAGNDTTVTYVNHMHSVLSSLNISMAGIAG